MVLLSYSRIYRDQRLSAQTTRGIFVATYKGILKSKQAARVVFTMVLCSYITKTAVLYHNRCSFKVQGMCILNLF